MKLDQPRTTTTPAWAPGPRTALVALVSLVLAAVAPAGGPVLAQGSPAPYDYLPSDDVTDGRFISQAGTALQTLVGVGTEFKIMVPPDAAPAATWELGIFDGDTGKDATGVVTSDFFKGHWDLGVEQLIFSLYADPAGDVDVATAAPLYQWTGNDAVVGYPGVSYASGGSPATDMPDNAWFDITLPTNAAALNANGEYQYRLFVELQDPSQRTESSFKLRATGLISTAAGRPFQFIAALRRVKDYSIVYPAWSGPPAPWILDPTTYDGRWSIFVHLPPGENRLDIWEGDFDHGSQDGLVPLTPDTDDPDTPPSPTFSAPTGSGFRLEGAQGAGSPPDDGHEIWRRSPAVRYDVIDPEGRVWPNDNPSGNGEWEKFTLATADCNCAADADHIVPELVPGFYEIRIEGHDLDNITAMLLGQDSWMVERTPGTAGLGDTVWHDVDGDGVLGAGEAGIGGVKLTAYQDVDGDGALSPGEPVAGTAATNPSGRYFIGGLANGRYLVAVDADNFKPGGALEGFEQTSTSGDQNVDGVNKVEPFGARIVDATDVIIADFGYKAIQQAGCPDCVEPSVSPNAALGGQVHLPILNFEGQNDVCRTWIEVQNVGGSFSKAALVTWGEPGFCPPQCAGPLKVECSGLLKPGSTWNFLGAQVPSGSKSGILFSFTAKQLSDIGVNLGFDDIVADVLCETLFFSVVGDCDDYRRFKKAYNEGLEFAGIPLDRAIGEPLAVEVLRHCPGDQTPGAEVSSKYGGIAGIDLGAYDPVFGGFAYYVPLLYAQSAGLDSVMYVQNGGLECSSVEIWFKAQDDCLRSRICEIFTLAPGETFQFDANDCVGPDFQGNAWLRSSQPLGMAVDIFGRDILMTYTGVPTELNFTFDPGSALFSIGSQVAFGPLVYSEFQGWDSGIQVQNMSSVVAAKVKVYFLDRSGDVITTLVDWICPRGSQTYFLPVIADLPGSWVGSVRVESQEWFSPGDPLVAPPNVTGIATLIKYSDAARSDTAEAMAYNLLAEQRAFDWQIGSGAGGTDSGIGLLAIPSLVKDLDGTGVTTEVAITNLVPKPGFTDFALYVYDQNGLLDYVCEKLNEKQVEYISFETWGYINPGFKGSAIISAVFWEHEVFGGAGQYVRNLLGLAAVVVERTGTRLGADIPGDEAAGTTAIPFRQDPETEFFFDFEGPLAPLCPGLVDDRPEPGSCPQTAVVACQDCPLPIQDLQTTSSLITINTTAIPTQCVVEDVDVLIDITHTFDGDLVVDLSSPDTADVQLFNSICGASNNIQAILDDEAAQPIGTVCPPLGMQPWDTAPPGQLTQFEGGGTNGTWKLDVFDQFGADQGTLNTWELQFTLSAQ